MSTGRKASPSKQGSSVSSKKSSTSRPHQETVVEKHPRGIFAKHREPSIAQQKAGLVILLGGKVAELRSVPDFGDGLQVNEQIQSDRSDCKCQAQRGGDVLETLTALEGKRQRRFTIEIQYLQSSAPLNDDENDAEYIKQNGVAKSKVKSGRVCSPKKRVPGQPESLKNENQNKAPNKGRKRSRQDTMDCDMLKKNIESSETGERSLQTCTLKRHVCNDCDLPFSSQKLLMMHKETHFAERQHVCEYCKKLYSTQAILRRHVKIHSGEKVHRCSYCDKAFSRSDDLQSHERIHTREQPYCCNECGALFRHQSSLATHRWTHREEQLPYPCLECGKAFRKKSGLIRHQHSHTGKQPFPCDICKLSFKQKGNMQMHKKRVHNNTLH